MCTQNITFYYGFICSKTCHHWIICAATHTGQLPLWMICAATHTGQIPLWMICAKTHIGQLPLWMICATTHIGQLPLGMIWFAQLYSCWPVSSLDDFFLQQKLINVYSLVCKQLLCSWSYKSVLTVIHSHCPWNWGSNCIVYLFLQCIHCKLLRDTLVKGRLNPLRSTMISIQTTLILSCSEWYLRMHAFDCAIRLTKLSWNNPFYSVHMHTECISCTNPIYNWEADPFIYAL